MAHRIEVGLADWVVDAAGDKIRNRILTDKVPGIRISKIRSLDLYTIDAELSKEQLDKIAKAPLCDPVIQLSSVNSPLDGDFDWAVEVGFKPGVTDNVGRTAKEVIALALDRPFRNGEGVYTSKQFRFSGQIEKDQLINIVNEYLANPLIQRCEIKAYDDFVKEDGFEPFVPKVSGSGRPKVENISLDINDDDLINLSREKVLALSLEELHAIRNHYQRADVQETRKAHGLFGDPTDIELEALAQTWSEHCKHKIFNATIKYTGGQKPPEEIFSLFDTYIKGLTEKVRKQKGVSDLCLSVFHDNAGVIKFTKDWSLVFKVETHNSPSALDPYGGALTGIVGVNRDPFGTGMGARLIFNTDIFCFADPNTTEPVPRGLLHPRRVLEGVREGVEHGGNKSGIPTINGSVVFDHRYLGKPLVYCGTAGILPADVNGTPGHEKRVLPNHRIVMVGGRIGKDGIHGATFSSEELHEGSPATAVQIGDPITQKRMTDFLLQARDLGLYSFITDNGAGGLSSSVGEMAQDCGGCELDLSCAPLKYQGLAPWEILLSEAQERMTLAVLPNKIDDFMSLAQRYQVEATDLGRFTDSGAFMVKDQGKCIALLDMDFLHNGLPGLTLEATWQPRDEKESSPAPVQNHAEMLKSMLSRLNICSKQYWVRQYDHEVQAGTVIKPLTGEYDDGPSDASVFRPLLDSMKAVVVSHGICPRYSDIDTYAMARAVVDEAVRNAVSVGADPDRMAGLDNFCWCDPVKAEKNPDGDFKLGQLVRANRGLYDICVSYQIPCISGKDSMKNDAVIDGVRISIPPTLLFSALGIIDDASKTVSMDIKKPSDFVLVLGMTRCELGASEYFEQTNSFSTRVPEVYPEETKELYRRLHRAITKGLVQSCHDCSDGGLAVALAESAFAGDLGISVDLGKIIKEPELDRDDFLLYSESTGRFVVTVTEENLAEFEKLFTNQCLRRVGLVNKDKKFEIKGLNGETIISSPIGELKKAWIQPLNF